MNQRCGQCLTGVLPALHQGYKRADLGQIRVKYADRSGVPERRVRLHLAALGTQHQFNQFTGALAKIDVRVFFVGHQEIGGAQHLRGDVRVRIKECADDRLGA